MKSSYRQQFSQSYSSPYPPYTSPSEDIRAVVAIDFGTTYSGFAYANKLSPKNIDTNSRWSGREGLSKTNTVLLYDSTCTEVLKWGEPALVHEPKKNRNNVRELGSPLLPQQHVAERFKLYLDENAERLFLPPNLDYRKAISDYLRKMKGVIEETLDKRWPGLKLSQVLFVLCVPAEWKPHTKAIMRDCAYKAGLLNDSIESHLEFTTEPEAAALHCLSVIEEHNLSEGVVFAYFCVIQRSNVTLKEETERTGDLCGSTYVDQEFIDFMGRTVGFTALQRLRSYAYGDLQKLVHRFFCENVKLPFTGDPDEFETIELDLESKCPSLIKYITGAERTNLENNEWIIELEFETVKKMFDPVVEKIIKLINNQLLDFKGHRKCMAMFLVGGFSESTYLRKRVRERFQGHVPIIASPRQPIAAIVKGAVKYGLDMSLVESRVLKWTYGVEVKADFDIRNDPQRLRTNDNKIWKFDLLAVRGAHVAVNQTFSKEYKPLGANQTMAVFHVYITKEMRPRYIKDAGMRILGTLKIALSRTPSLGRERPVEFGLTFGTMEIKATAKNKVTGEIYHATFELDVKGKK
ncbi:9075_t:CDS:10 [Cetraspora pellucida]|uniref:9075_t:CDS:1 n=1 Tax=Cetraspora pellucida TaxID=1433469 RepID=A0ACA9LAJ4_9GLOM|nr:9075_t:CDS:10 [Cetraspora pellucida]